MMRLLLLAPLLVASVFARDVSVKTYNLPDDYTPEFVRFMSDFEKKYETYEEMQERKANFEANLADIDAHNRLYLNNQSTYFLRVNKFSDWTFEEFSAHTKCVNPRKNGLGLPLHQVQADFALPEYINYEELGYVTPVKSQGLCGSCYAFSSTGALEGQLFRRTGKLVSLSEQNLVDCALTADTRGCQGGEPLDCFDYARRHGLDTEASYPYVAQDYSHCQFDKQDVAVKSRGAVVVPEGDDGAVLQALVAVGPLSVLVDANTTAFMSYGGGVLNVPECHKKIEELDHAVLLTGYGVAEDGTAFYRVKNSWGEGWGEDGYFRIVIDNNQCGIASQASYPLVD